MSNLYPNYDGPRTYTASAVCVDDSLGPFPCLIWNERTWNGWALSFFDYATALHLIDEIKEGNVRHIWDGADLYEMDIYDATDYEDPRGHLLPTIERDGLTYYAIGDGFTWDEFAFDCRGCGLHTLARDAVDLTRYGVDPVPLWECKQCAGKELGRNEAEIRSLAKHIAKDITDLVDLCQNSDSAYEWLASFFTANTSPAIGASLEEVARTFSELSTYTATQNN